MGRHKFLNEELAADNDPANEEVDDEVVSGSGPGGTKMRPLISYLTSNHEYTIPVMTTTAISVFLLFSSSPWLPYRNTHTHTHTLRAEYEQWTSLVHTLV